MASFVSMVDDGAQLTCRLSLESHGRLHRAIVACARETENSATAFVADLFTLETGSREEAVRLALLEHMDGWDGGSLGEEGAVGAWMQKLRSQRAHYQRRVAGVAERDLTEERRETIAREVAASWLVQARQQSYLLEQGCGNKPADNKRRRQRYAAAKAEKTARVAEEQGTEVADMRVQSSAAAEAEGRRTASQQEAAVRMEAAAASAAEADDTWLVSRRTCAGYKESGQFGWRSVDELRRKHWSAVWAQVRLLGWGMREARSGEPAAGLMLYCQRCKLKDSPGTCAACGGWTCMTCGTCVVGSCVAEEEEEGDGGGAGAGAGGGSRGETAGRKSQLSQKPLEEMEERGYDAGARVVGAEVARAPAASCCAGCGYFRLLSEVRACGQCGKGLVLGTVEAVWAATAAHALGRELTGGLPWVGFGTTTGDMMSLGVVEKLAAEHEEAAECWSQWLQRGGKRMDASTLQPREDLPWAQRSYVDRHAAQAGLWRLKQDGVMFVFCMNVLERRMRAGLQALGKVEQLGTARWHATNAQRDGAAGSGFQKCYTSLGSPLSTGTTPGPWILVNGHKRTGVAGVCYLSGEETAAIFRSAHMLGMLHLGAARTLWQWAAASADVVCAMQPWLWALKHGVGHALRTRQTHGRRAMVTVGGVGVCAFDAIGEAAERAFSKYGLAMQRVWVADRWRSVQDTLLQSERGYETIFGDATGPRVAFEAALVRALYVSIDCSFVSYATHGMTPEQVRLQGRRLARLIWLILTSICAGRETQELPYAIVIENGTGVKERAAGETYTLLRSCLFSLPYAWAGGILSPHDEGLGGVHRRRRWWGVAVRRDLFRCCGEEGCGCAAAACNSRGVEVQDTEGRAAQPSSSTADAARAEEGGRAEFTSSMDPAFVEALRRRVAALDRSDVASADAVAATTARLTDLVPERLLRPITYSSQGRALQTSCCGWQSTPELLAFAHCIETAVRGRRAAEARAGASAEPAPVRRFEQVAGASCCPTEGAAAAAHTGVTAAAACSAAGEQLVVGEAGTGGQESRAAGKRPLGSAGRASLGKLTTGEEQFKELVLDSLDSMRPAQLANPAVATQLGAVLIPSGATGKKRKRMQRIVQHTVEGFVLGQGQRESAAEGGR